MRIPLQDLAPEWLASGPGRERMGVSWECLCGRHRVEAWFFTPLDREGPVTLSPGLEIRCVEGDDFSNLSLDWGFRCGEDYMHVTDGFVFQG